MTNNTNRAAEAAQPAATSGDAPDLQQLKALAGTGIELTKPRPKRPDTINCTGCGRFIGATERYLGYCSNCGTDYRP